MPLVHASAIEGVVVVGTNVTERDAAAVDRDRFLSLSLDLLCVASLKGYLVRINPAFTRTLDVTAGEPLYIRADAVQIERLLLNLCLNARDALDGRGTIRVVTARHPAASGERESRVRLSVIDDGEGMPPSVRERIFEPFFTTKQPGRGTGLGLPVVYGIVKRHDAAIAIESEPGKGTSVHVDFSTHSHRLRLRLQRGVHPRQHRWARRDT